MSEISTEFAELVETRSDDLIKEIFSELDKTIIALSLKTIDPKTSEIIFKNLSENDSNEIKNRMSGTVRIEEIEKAQKEIIDIINNKNIS